MKAIHDHHDDTPPSAPMPIARPEEPAPPGELPGINRISPSAPLDWLKRGWGDLVATRFVGLFYGAAFVAMGYAITWIYATRWQLTMGLIGGFFLMGPFVCTGLYELSRQRDRGQPISLFASLFCWRRNLGSIALFAVALTFLMIVWARVSVILFALASTTDFPTLQGVLKAIFSPDNAGFLLPWMGVGFVFASLVFAVGVIAVPLMLDRDIDAPWAMFTSARCLLSNPRPLYFWASLVVLIIGTSLALGFVPLLVTAPLVGHATWHAYRDLVTRPADT